MIAVVGSPSFQPVLRGHTTAGGDAPPFAATQPGGTAAPIPEGRAAGLAAGIAAAAVAAGASVQVVGKVGDDPAGEAVVRSLARVGVGHAALSRTSAATPVREPDDPPGDDEAEPVAALLAEEATSDRDLAAASTTARRPAARSAATMTRTALDGGQPLDAADVALGLRYLGDLGVIVAVGLDDEAVARVVADAGAFSAGPVVAIMPAGVPVPVAFGAATVLEAPEEDPDAAFASFVGRFAAALDRGVAQAAAFRAAAVEGGWSAAE